MSRRVVPQSAAMHGPADRLPRCTTARAWHERAAERLPLVTPYPTLTGPPRQSRAFLMMSISSGHVNSATKRVRKVTNMSSKKSRPARGAAAQRA